MKHILTAVLLGVCFHASGQTFPLNLPFPDQAFVCLEKADAFSIAEADARTDEKLNALLQVKVTEGKCGAVAMMFVYEKQRA